MNDWLQENLVCPRDHGALHSERNRLRCAQGHEYPVIDGIPVMLLSEAPPTQWRCADTLKKAALLGAFDRTDAQQNTIKSALATTDAEVDEHVQRIVMGTCGYLYAPLVNKLPRYPIPELRLPNGEGKVFLDIGCNWGRWCIAAGRKGYQPIGLDPGLADIFAARRISQQLGIAAQFVVADGRYLPFAPHSIDTIFSYSVLQHFAKSDVALVAREIARTLQPRGTSFIQMPNRYGIRSFYHLARRRFREADGFDVRYWTRSEMQRLFEDSIGPTTLEVDGFFGLGIQGNDLDLLPWRYRLIVQLSERLRKANESLGLLDALADSLYVKSVPR